MKKIAIVDDDYKFVESLETLLQSKGFNTVSAYDGQAGYHLVKREKPDLLLLDVMMAHSSEGFEISRQLKNDSDTSRIPVIIITGVSEAMNLPFKYEPDDDWLPVKAVLEKPVKPDELLNLIGDLII